MTKLKFSLLGLWVTASVAVSLLIQHQTEARLREKNRHLLEQADLLAQLTEESQRLAGLVVQTASPPATEPAAELTRLRTETQSLQKQIKERKKAPASGLPSPTPSAGSPEIHHPPEYWNQLHQLAGRKPMDAATLATALKEYAHDHAGQIPANLDLAGSYLLKQDAGDITGNNQFDLVYQGSLDQLKSIPWGEVALIRDRQTWRAPSGKVARVYGMLNGSGQIVESDDNFKTWEAEHIIAAPSVNQ